MRVRVPAGLLGFGGRGGPSPILRYLLRTAGGDSTGYGILGVFLAAYKDKAGQPRTFRDTQGHSRTAGIGQIIGQIPSRTGSCRRLRAVPNRSLSPVGCHWSGAYVWVGGWHRENSLPENCAENRPLRRLGRLTSRLVAEPRSSDSSGRANTYKSLRGTIVTSCGTGPSGPDGFLVCGLKTWRVAAGFEGNYLMGPGRSVRSRSRMGRG